MPYYRRLGEVPRKRHTVLRGDDGSIRGEELMGHAGFSQESSLLYHRGSPSALVRIDALDDAGLELTPNVPVTPVHLRAREVEIGDDLVGSRHVLAGNDDVTIGDMTGTDVSVADVDLGAFTGGGDAAQDTVTVTGTDRPDNVNVNRVEVQAVVTGLRAQTRIANSELLNDTLRINTQGGDDRVTVDPDAELCLSEAQQFHTCERIESEIELEVHRNIQRTDVRLCLPQELGHHGTRSFLEPRVFRRSLPSDRSILSLRLLPLNFKTLKLARDCSRKRLMPNRKGQNAVIGG